MFTILQIVPLFAYIASSHVCMSITVDLMAEIESNGMASPVSDFTEDNYDELVEAFEEAYNSSYKELGDETDNFRDISSLGIVDVKGDDSVGRKIIVVYACKLPPVSTINHEHFLK